MIQTYDSLSVDEEAMKEYYRSLKVRLIDQCSRMIDDGQSSFSTLQIAAGLLKHINDVQRPLFAYNPNTGVYCVNLGEYSSTHSCQSDFDERIIASMTTQALAEAQEGC